MIPQALKLGINYQSISKYVFYLQYLPYCLVFLISSSNNMPTNWFRVMCWVTQQQIQNLMTIQKFHLPIVWHLFLMNSTRLSFNILSDYMKLLQSVVSLVPSIQKKVLNCAFLLVGEKELQRRICKIRRAVYNVRRILKLSMRCTC